MKVNYLLIVIVCLLAGIVFAADNSSYIDVDASTYSAKDFSGMAIEGGFNVSGGVAHWWNASSGTSGGYSTLDTSTGLVTNIGKPASVQTNGYGDPFGIYDSQNNCFYASSYLDGGTSCLYKYDYSTEIWSEEGSAVNMYGGAVYDSDLYISGLREPWTGGYGNTFISLYDFSENHAHDSLIEVGGASAHLAVDNQGNAYYATYQGSDTSLYRWTASQISSVINDLAGGETDTYLTLADGQKLTDYAGGANGIVVDDAGNVFFTYNGSSSALGMWNGTAGDGLNYDIIATLDPSQYYGWFGPLAIDGDFLAGDPLYGSYNFGAPITEITYVPEPATMAILALGGLMLRGRRNYRETSI